ncbi:uncharacterized protein CCOS01_15971 [Colletotrichum costaricense]|uniref:Secreted protein n=1 Tax=Colletotrichum costaricense TaxID=1209916 RepID=A0AAI9YGU3_9PEZI|nr:uncharacterized protein CCOS01_15971 [Colletotrichum costaricense]KAK1508310.1 hypothetical protein CCOS01_15971 [Colletotrichum costaricense]
MWMPRRPDCLRRVALRAAWRLALLVAGKLNGYGRTRPTRPKKPMVQRLSKECESVREGGHRLRLGTSGLSHADRPCPPWAKTAGNGLGGVARVFSRG